MARAARNPSSTNVGGPAEKAARGNRARSREQAAIENGGRPAEKAAAEDSRGPAQEAAIVNGSRWAARALRVAPFAAEAADPDCLEPAAAAALLARTPWTRLVVLGDSVAAGIREPVEGYRDACFADRVGQALGHERSGFAYWNLGQRDLRLAEIRGTQLAPALAFEPDLAIVVAGGNDALRRSFDEQALREGLAALVAQLAERGARVVTIGLFDLARSGLLPDEYARPLAERFDRLDAVTGEVAAEQGALHVDTHHHPRASDPAIFASDLMHANARGHAIAAAAIVHELSAAAA